MATEKEENSPTEGPYDSEKIMADLERFAQEAESLLERMGEILKVVKCESAYFCEPDSYVCTEPATENITIQHKDGLEITLDLCLPCMNALIQRHKELSE